MRNCEYCGRPLNDGQICNCQDSQNANYYNQQQYGQQQYYNQQQYGQPPINQPNIYVPPKQNNILRIIIIIIAVILLLTAVGGVLYLIFGSSIMGGSNESKLESQNSYSSDLAKAVNSVMTDLSSQGYDIGDYFISSDSDKSFNYKHGDDLDYKMLNDRIHEYFKNSTKESWIAVYENGSAYYVASADSWNSEIIGTYPLNGTLDSPKGYNGKTYPQKEKLNDIYEDTSETIRQTYIDNKKAEQNNSQSSPEKKEVDPAELETQHEYTEKLAKAINSVMSDLKSSGFEIGNYFLSCNSNESYTYSYGDDFNYNEINDLINEYFPESTDCLWCAVYENGSVYYAASAISWTSETVGTYPLIGTADAPRGYNGKTYSESQELIQIYNDTVLSTQNP